MEISFSCEMCGQNLVVNETADGQIIDCPKCGTSLEVPHKARPRREGAARVPETGHCFSCGKEIQADASVCQFCGYGKVKAKRSARNAEPAKPSRFLPRYLAAFVIVFALMTAGVFFGYKSWKNQPCEFSVDVFIRTKGGESIKCGLVEVRVFEEKDINSSQTEILKSLSNLAPKIQANFTDAAKARERAVSIWEMTELSLIVEYGAKWADLPRNWYPLAKLKKETAELEYNAALAKLHEWPKAVYVIINDRLPKPVTAVKTDADGRCTGKVPKPGRYAFAAYFSRTVGAVAEHTCWLVWVNFEDKKPKKIMLSNDNMMGSGSTESVLTDAPQP